MLCVPPRALLGVHEVVVHSDLENTTAGGNEREIAQLVLELLQQPLRQTDGSRGIASLGAVFDRDPHGRECSGAEAPGALSGRA